MRKVLANPVNRPKTESFELVSSTLEGNYLIR